jgi:hypothetical protein
MIGITADLPVFDAPLMTFTTPGLKSTLRGPASDRGQRTSFSN